MKSFRIHKWPAKGVSVWIECRLKDCFLKIFLKRLIMARYIFCVFFMLFLPFMSGCKDAMEKMNERQYLENGVWDLVLWDQSLWVDDTEVGNIEPDESEP